LNFFDRHREKATVTTGEIEMIDLTRLEESSTKTEVRPSDNIFAELGKNTYDYKDLLSELIDNSVAARRSDRLLTVSIIIAVDNENRAHEFIISDNATGIPESRLGIAITPAGVRGENSLNEHGLGMKQAVSALGKLKYLATKTEDESRARVVREFKFGQLDTFYADFDRDSGTEIAVTDLKPIVITNTSSITRSIIPYLGARYRQFLRPGNPLLSLNLQLVSATDNTTLYEWIVQEVKPIYFHPATRENRPVILRHPLQGNGWRAELTFGYAPKDDAEYEELGVEIPTKFHPYKVSLNKQGLDIILHDRVILFHQLSELGIVNQKHSDYNDIRGEINLLRGFHTAITKNSMIFDDNFGACIEEARQILSGEKLGPGNRIDNYLRRKVYPDEIPEKLLRDRLIEWLSNNPLNKRQHINKEYVVEGIEGFIDILADGEAWEIKVDQADARDVYQLFMYMDVGEFPKGFLVANNYSPGAYVAVRHILEKHSKEIVLAPRNQFPINHHPTNAERDEYY
jgi:hypothetical protein